MSAASGSIGTPVARTRPSAGVIAVNVVFLWVSMSIAAVPLWPIYESTALVAVVVGGLIAATLVAVAGAWFRWGAWVVVLVTIAVFVAIGVPLAVPTRARNVVIPTIEGLRDLVAGVALGWKQLLTITLPVGAYEALLVPALVLVLGLGTLGLSVALRTRAREAAVLAPLALYLAAIAFGPEVPLLGFITPVALVAVLLFWLVWFRRRRHRESIEVLTANAAPREAAAGLRAAIGAVLIVALSAGAAVVASATVPPAEDRTVLRSSLQQPFDPREFVSPLAGFRSYWQEDVVDRVLFRVNGVPDEQRIRLATMDTYDGVVFSVGSSLVAAPSGAFVRVPTSIDQSSVTGSPLAAEIALDRYTGVWVPTIGMLESVTFQGPDAATRRDSFFVNRVTGTAAVLGGIAAPDAYTLQAIEPDQPLRADWATLEPGGAVVPVATGVPEEVAATVDRWTRGVEGAGAQLVAILDGMALEGYISHGVGEDEPPSRSGHGADRLVELLSAPRMIGDAEQYAVTAALMAREIGFPSRVVMGFVADNGVVRSGDVAAWIEINTSRYGWVAIDPTPPFRDIPEELPQETAQVSRPPTIVPPPVVETETIDRQPTPDSEADLPPEADPALQVLFAVLRVVGWLLVAAAIAVAPFLVIIAAKLRRRRLRRLAETPGERIRGGWREFHDTVVDHGIAPASTATRTEVAAVAGGTQALLLAAVADRASFAPEEPTITEADAVWNAVDDLRAALDVGRTRWERVKARISVRSLGGYSVSRFLRRESRS